MWRLESTVGVTVSSSPPLPLTTPAGEQMITNDPVTDKQRCTASFRHVTRHKPGARGRHEVRIMRSDISVHQWFDQRGLRTPAWTFDGEMPGKLIEVTQDQSAEIAYENRVPRDDPTPFEAHFDADPEAPASGAGPMGHGAWIRDGLLPEFVVHLQGAVVPPSEDGNPAVSQPILLGENEHCVYGNRQRPALLWYHDHSMGQTAGTVYAGLAAPYVIRGNAEQRLVEQSGLPHGPRELFLILQDKSFEFDSRGRPTVR